ncbi:MAG: sodium:proton antiporter NhaD [Bacteroidales bacterium]|nr:sodium:proton antiporter NhaD [Bacteroidales bacterium]
MIVFFVLGYLLIALEHPVKINKSATSLLLATLLWVCLAIGGPLVLADPAAFNTFQMENPGSTFLDWLTHGQLVHALGETAEIIFFLLGAMTIVELIDTMGGFKLITDKIATTNAVKLMWLISLLTFFMSAILDNMTTAIVMVAVLHKLIDDRKQRWTFTGMVILAANAGGAWSPMGDVTTIMLWVSGKISAANIIKVTFLASLASIVVPLAIMSFIVKGKVDRPTEDIKLLDSKYAIPVWESRLYLLLGVGLLVCVPVFKTLTHLPPYLGMLGALGILWVTSEIIHRNTAEEQKHPYAISSILTRVDISSVLFFLGILMAVNALATAGHLEQLSLTLDKLPIREPGKYYVINTLIGLFSSVIDNVPLVAGAMGMYHFPMDHYFWEMMAYCAGTGGSILIIGSAAGVATMGMEKIDFIWYLKRISWIALIGYFAGAGVFILQKDLSGAHANLHATESPNVGMNVAGVRDYLTSNTFCVVEKSNDNQNLQDSSVVRFFSIDTDKPLPYYGTLISTYRTQQNQLEVFSKNIDVCRGNVTVSNTVGDTMAPVLFGSRQLIVTRSGRVFFVTPNGAFPLTRIQ